MVPLHQANRQTGLWSPSQDTLTAVPALAGTVCQGCVCLSVCYACLQEVAGRLQLPAFSRVRPAEHTGILLRAPTPGFILLPLQPQSGVKHPWVCAIASGERPAPPKSSTAVTITKTLSIHLALGHSLGCHQRGGCNPCFSLMNAALAASWNPIKAAKLVRRAG